MFGEQLEKFPQIADIGMFGEMFPEIFGTSKERLAYMPLTTADNHGSIKFVY